MEAGDEVVQVGARERIGLEAEFYVGTQVVNPQFFRPGSFAGRLAVEEEHVGFDALGIEDAGGQAQKGMDIALMQQFPAHGFAGPAFEEDIIRHDDRRAAVDLQQSLDVLDEVQLFVAGGDPEVVANHGSGLMLDIALLGDVGDTALLAEGRIGEHHIEAVTGVGGETVIHTDRGGPPLTPMPCK